MLILDQIISQEEIDSFKDFFQDNQDKNMLTTKSMIKLLITD